MKKHVGVIFGSRSCEREVAIISAVQLMRFADPEKYDIVPVYIDEHGSWYTGEALKEIGTYKPFNPEKKGIRKVFPDLSSGSGALLYLNKGSGLLAKDKLEIAARIDVYIVVMHGMNGEDGTLQGLMELANIPYTSTGVTGSAVGMDKIIMKEFFSGADLPVLPGEWYTRREYAEDAPKIISDVSRPVTAGIWFFSVIHCSVNEAMNRAVMENSIPAVENGRTPLTRLPITLPSTQ